MNEKTFVEYALKLGIKIEENKLRMLDRYYELLVEKNKVMNLTNIIEKDDVYLKHFYDSLTISMVCDLNSKESLCDIGTGAGFPGLVLKIIYPHLKVVLVDSLDKRIKFLSDVIKDLGLENIEAIHVRAEDYAKTHRDYYDVVTSRAVARLSILTELCLPLTKVDGYFISMKSHAKDEINEIGKNLVILNSKIDEIKTFSLPFEDSIRTLIRIKKERLIDKKYPRDFKEIKRKPL